MTHLFAPAARAAILTLLVAGCARIHPGTTPTARMSAADWRATLTQVDTEIAAKRYAGADRLLAEFQRSHLENREAPEATYYRALYRVDPANPAASSREAGVLLDAYLVDSAVTTHHADALVLRRLVTVLEEKPTVVTVTRAPAASRSDDSKSKDDEIARLREELTKAKAELERIKRRLAAPAP